MCISWTTTHRQRLSVRLRLDSKCNVTEWVNVEALCAIFEIVAVEDRKWRKR